MSSETLSWLNQNVLVGMTSQRGEAWHYKKSEQGDEPNHYDGPIPIEDVRRRLFFWQAVELPMFYEAPTGKMQVPNKKVVVRNDTFATLGVPSEKYQPHQYDEWLLKNVSTLLDDDLVIGSAGLLKGGAVAWVQIEMPESMKVADVEFRPNLLATTSFNGSIATTYKRTVTIVVCDNTRQMALDENGQQFSVRHTSKSLKKIVEAREALSIVHTMGADFAKELETLLNTKVSDKQYETFLQKLVPATPEETQTKQTRADNTRGLLLDMWKNDPRVAPWKNTAYGAIQSVNTFRQHERPTRGSTLQIERTMLDTLKDKTGEKDDTALRLLKSVLV